MKTGDKKMSQYMMRLRVGAQAFTVAAVMAGAMYHQSKPKSTKRTDETTNPSIR